MSEQKKGLGRGLSALLGDAPRPAEDAQGRRDSVREVDIAQIRPNPAQPRQHFDEESLAELAESIRQHGVLQPILLRPVEGGYELIAGERRWRASQRAQLHTIPALVREHDDSSSAELALIENVQRADLNAIEEAEGYQTLIGRFGHTQDNVAKLVGKSRSHVANLLRLLGLPDSVRQMLMRGDISMGHARAVLTAEEPEALAAEIADKGLSVRQAEELAKLVKPGAGYDIARASARNARTVDTDLAALERQLSDMLGLKVQVKHGGKGGTVNLTYSSLDQLDMICQRLSGEPI
ncbi:ParB/RepB/Spo0J family partition protein [Sphingomonas alba]|uniref:ParB/RepB/Spo0J family partition protein n=1 Tax=Sphingomonas alba TaxID=2908208 RepID=A0ABT0RMG5_9SPHN|nr:ParB/RepB/Spo0J family partition protein [Sphingomonas alba]MCL6683823.1 ParB/RepB/Spo0J family partition protein [Sphingomonas alba]